jgi:hypothetical protein
MAKRYQGCNQNLYIIEVQSVLLWYTDSDYILGIFWPLCCLFFYDIQIRITPLVYFGHCVVCSSSESLYHRRKDNTMAKRYQGCNQNLYIIEVQTTQWPKYTKVVIRIHCIVCSSMIYRFWLPLGIFWPLCCLFFYDLQILITPLVSFVHCVVYSSMIYRFWLSPKNRQHNGQKIPRG